MDGGLKGRGPLGGRVQPARPAFLQEGETPLRLEGRHPLSALDAWIGIAVLLLLVCGGAFVVAAFVDAAFVPYALAISAVATVLAVAWALAVWLRVRTSLNVVTPERVYHAHGMLRFFLSQTTYDRVTDLHVHQSFFGRRFGFGTVLVQTAGQGVHLIGVRDPLGAKRAIEEAREAMVRRLVAAHRGKKAAVAGPTGTAKSAAKALAPRRLDAPPVWTGAPTLASMLTQVVPTALFFVPFAIISLAGAPLAGGFALIMPALLLLVLGIMVVNMVIRLRTTHYEVHGWGVAVASGWLGRSRVECRYEKVTDVAVTQGVWGRVFGFGTIRINTAGGVEAPVNFVGVRAPDEVKAIVDRARLGTA